MKESELEKLIAGCHEALDTFDEACEALKKTIRFHQELTQRSILQEYAMCMTCRHLITRSASL